MKCRHKPSILQAHHKLFQHIPESCGALHSPCGGAPQQRGPLTPQTQTRPNRLHTHTHSPTQAPCTPALAHTSSLDTDLTRNTRAPHFTPQHWLRTRTRTNTIPYGTEASAACAIWDCISSSSLCGLSARARSRMTLRKKLAQFSELVFVALECQICAALALRLARSFNAIVRYPTWIATTTSRPRRPSACSAQGSVACGVMRPFFLERPRLGPEPHARWPAVACRLRHARR